MGHSDTEMEEKRSNLEEKMSNLGSKRSSIASAVESLGAGMPDVELAGPEREAWGNHCEFFLSSLGLAVGLGNIWRFPYVAYDNGGATFLIPYFIMLVIIGIPMFFLEMILGQYAGLSATKIYARMAPGLRGMGYGMICIPTLINMQYVVIMAYSMYFLFVGMQSELPWQDCQNNWNRDHCHSIPEADACTAQNLTFYHQACQNGTYFCNDNNLFYDEDTPNTCFNITHTIDFIDVTYRSPASEEHWYFKVLGFDVENGHVNTEVNSWSKWGKMRWEILGCLFLSWFVIWASLIKGVQSYGKVVYFTTLFPYVVLTILLGYVATLEGFGYGMEFYFIPRDWNDIFDPSVWNDAAGQIFYSLGVAVGSQLLLSSYNGFRTNAHRDALLIGVFNSATSIYAGLVVFGSLGYIAKAKGVPMDKVVQAEAGLAFIVYPEAVSIMDIPQLFSFLFFLMLNLLAVSSVCAQTEALMAAIIDEVPSLRKKRIQVLAMCCFASFLCGVSMCFDSGFLMFTIMNNRCSNAILLMAFIELVTASWFYGANNILRHIKEMGMDIPAPMMWYWWLCWVVFTPLLIILVTISAWMNFPGDFFLDYEFPGAVTAMGWMMELLSVFVVFIVAVFTVIKRWRAGKTVAFIQAGPMMSPSRLWGPRADSGLPMPSTAKVNDAFLGDGV